MTWTDPFRSWRSPTNLPAAFVRAAGVLCLTACVATGGGKSETTPIAEGQIVEAGDGSVSPGVVDVTPEGTDSALYVEPLPLRPIPADIDIGERPSLETDEAGLWMQMDRAERQLATSGKRIRDPELESYITRIVCDLADQYCGDVRVYLVRTPIFNATMAPNGVMQVWSGLLLRAQDEAQLAAVLGHEIAHYLRRHSIKRFRDVRSKLTGLAVFRIAAAVFGVAPVGDVAALGMMGSIQSYSRDHERESDFMGQNLMVESGYDPMAASELWAQLNRERARMEEIDPDKKSPRSVFFASHPPSEEREENLRLRAEAFAQSGVEGRRGREDYIAALGEWREVFLRDELELGEHAQSEALLEILVDSRPEDGALRYFQGELYRARSQDGDADRALAAYAEAAELGYAEAGLYRGWGLTALKNGDNAAGIAALKTYLDLAPEAPDAGMIRFMIGSADATS
ncbi:M48 family metalloprotease [Pacificispira sp.]|uniref:M48 family metalloprotease n=1 Tax=Pacificispira sp. TaxID=2888761 RepID=UPI003BA910D0